MKLKSEYIFFISLFSIVLLFFLHAFKIFYFQDDYFFLRISNISQVSDFFKFFSPLKSYFYRPLSSEVFYFFTHIFHNSAFFAHTVVFATFYIGLVFLYKAVLFLTKNKLVSYLTVFMYSIHVTHVFQLYYLGTAQEVFAFSFLTITFYLFLIKRYTASIIFFILALLSKESVVLFPIFLVAAALFHIPYCTNHDRKVYLWFAALSCVALLFYKSGSANVVASEATYALQMNPRLIANNILWYSAWSTGFPNFLPDYFTSILKPPLPALWSYFDTAHAKLYIYGLFFYIFFFTSLLILAFRSLVKKSNIKVGLFLLFGFLLFVSPTLPIVHKWMVRLTIPVIFTSFIQAYCISVGLKDKSFNFLAVLVLGIYAVWNFLGIRVHETTSNYTYESAISRNVESYMNIHAVDIARHSSIYFKDPNEKSNAWGWSKKLETTLHGADFVDFYFPGQKKKVLYGYKDKQASGSYVIDAQQLLP